MSDGFQNNIQSWVSLDNRIKNLSQQVKDLRSQRGSLLIIFLLMPNQII